MEKKKAMLKVTAAFVILTFCEWFFFRNILGSGYDVLIGDRGDGRLTTLLTEHWWKFFTGKEKFSEIAMFYPAEDVFGYTDLFLGYGIVHSFLRLAGLDMFEAYKWTLIFIHYMGTVLMYYLLRKTFRIHFGWALFGTLAFSFSDTYARHLCHTQLGAMSMLPLLLILFIGFVRHFEDRKRRNLYAYTFIAWFVLITYNSWYIAYFTGMFCLVFLLVYLITLKRYKIAVFCYLKEQIRYAYKDIIGYLVFLIVLYIPFIQVYLPALNVSSGYSYKLCSSFLPELIDMLNVSEGNWISGWISQKLQLADRGYNGEVIMGFSIILLAWFMVLGWVNHKKTRAAATGLTDSEKYSALLADTIFVTILVCLLLVIRLGSNGVSLWGIVYHMIPMAKSVRAVARFFLWLSFPMAVITACLANKYIHLRRAGFQAAISACAVILIFLSNINTEGVNAYWNHSYEKEFLEGMPTPPADAEVFYIIDTAQTGAPAFIYQLDAFEIATWFDIKTINGYSGQLPPDWASLGLSDVTSDTYEENMAVWIDKYDLEHVYAFDLATCTWTSIK